MSAAFRTHLLEHGPAERVVDVWSRTVPALVAFAAVVGMASANGGYFPTEWGWAAIGFLLIAASSMLVLDRIALGRLEWTMLAGLGAFTLWVAVSISWSPSFAQPILETERAVLYLAASLAVFLITPRRSPNSLLAGLLTGIVTVSGYALATRLAPDRVGTYSPVEGYQLSEPVGYWNALGILASMGVLLAVGFAAHGRRVMTRSLAAGSLLILVPTLYFTFSRGALLALAVGGAAAFVLDLSRLKLAFATLVVAPAPALVIWLGSRSEALTEQGRPLSEAARHGHRLGLALLGLGLLSMGAIYGLARAERRVAIGRRTQIACAAALLALALAAAGVIAARAGSPLSLVGRQYDAFRAPLQPTGGDLSRRLFSVSGNGRADYWRVAWGEYTAHPWLGSGAGSFERYWVLRRPTAFYARDAHNLYLETLAELGPVGLLLLVTALAIPLAALPRARHWPLGAATAGAYVAFLLHASLDWDWEVICVTLAALFCGAALVIRARPEGPGHSISHRVRIGVLAVLLLLVAFTFVAHVGNSSLAASVDAASRGNYARAEAEARKATRWAPWSFEPWQRLGEAQVAQGDLHAARASFRQAIERDHGNWGLWYELALASEGDARRDALERAARLNPLGEEIAALRKSEG